MKNSIVAGLLVALTAACSGAGSYGTDAQDEVGTNEEGLRRVALGDLVASKFSTSSLTNGAPDVTRADIAKAVVALNKMGNKLDLEDVMVMLDLDNDDGAAIYHVFRNGDDDSNNAKNYDVMDRLTSGKYGNPVDPKAGAAIKQLLEMGVDDAASFRYDFQLGESPRTVAYWHLMQFMNYDIGNIVDGDELKALMGYQDLILLKGQESDAYWRDYVRGNVDTLRAFGAAVRFRPGVKANFDAWVAKLAGAAQL